MIKSPSESREVAAQLIALKADIEAAKANGMPTAHLEATQSLLRSDLRAFLQQARPNVPAFEQKRAEALTEAIETDEQAREMAERIKQKNAELLRTDKAGGDWEPIHTELDTMRGQLDSYLIKKTNKARGALRRNRAKTWDANTLRGHAADPRNCSRANCSVCESFWHDEYKLDSRYFE